MKAFPQCASIRVVLTTTKPRKKIRRQKRPRGEAPKDASDHQPRRIDACYHAVGAGARQRAIAHKLAQSAPLICFRGALAFRRFAAALAAATERRDSAQAVLRANERMRVLPAPSIALKRSTPRSGRNAGGNDARAARERSANPRAGAASRSTLWIASGMRPRLSGMLYSNRKEDQLSMRKGQPIGRHNRRGVEVPSVGCRQQISQRPGAADRLALEVSAAGTGCAAACAGPLRDAHPYAGRSIALFPNRRGILRR